MSAIGNQLTRKKTSNKQSNYTRIGNQRVKETIFLDTPAELFCENWPSLGITKLSPAPLKHAQSNREDVKIEHPHLWLHLYSGVKSPEYRSFEVYWGTLGNLKGL